MEEKKEFSYKHQGIKRIINYCVICREYYSKDELTTEHDEIRYRLNPILCQKDYDRLSDSLFNE